MQKTTQMPLLYIAQPEIPSPEVKVQESYDSRKQKRKAKELDSQKITDQAFKNLALADKIVYLLQVAERTAAIKCEIVLEQKIERGIIIAQEEETVKIRTLNNEIRTLHKGDIKDIRLIGF